MGSAKTNVSMLQEMMVKKKTVPNYELIHDGGGTHMNTFTYRVACDGLVATGTGRCKKDAKHAAAKNMLETIAAARSYPQLPAVPVDLPVRTPLPEKPPLSPKVSASDEPFLNAIGELKDFCAENELQDPEYEMISDVGPPHARIFTYGCTVSSFREVGRAMTKKQAKHEASKKMLERLTEVVTNLVSEKDVGKTTCNERVVQLYSDLTVMPIKRTNLGVRPSEYYVKFNNSFSDETIPTRKQVLERLDSLASFSPENPIDCVTAETLLALKTSFTEFLILIDTDMHTFIYDCQDNVNKMLIVRVSLTPSILEIETGKNLVVMEFQAIIKVVQTLRLLMR